MFVLFFIMVLAPMGPMADVDVGSADATGVSRHVYSLHDGSTEYVAPVSYTHLRAHET